VSFESIKKLSGIQPKAPQHWVGDGFPVRTLFSYADSGALLSPFLLLDYAGPMEFAPTEKRRGIGEHPHGGFETVTIVYAGQLEHRDSSGGGGLIGPGDVQWMTAGSGVIHEEFHGGDFARRGGMFEIIQIWVNLPAKDKMSAPRYQGISKDRIPTVTLQDKQGTLRVIAGEYAGVEGPAKTFTPIHLWDLRLTAHRPFDLAVPSGYTTAVVVRTGAIRTRGATPIEAAKVGLFDRAGDIIRIESADNATALLLSGAPIDEPVVSRGPFVMNSSKAIRQAVGDYRSGKMGQLC